MSLVPCRGCTAVAVLSWLSLLRLFACGFLVIYVLSGLCRPSSMASFVGCMVHGCLWRLTCHGYPIYTVLSLLSSPGWISKAALPCSWWAPMSEKRIPWCSFLLVGESCPGPDRPHLRHKTDGADGRGDGVRHEEGTFGQDYDGTGYFIAFGVMKGGGWGVFSSIYNPGAMWETDLH